MLALRNERANGLGFQTVTEAHDVGSFLRHAQEVVRVLLHDRLFLWIPLTAHHMQLKCGSCRPPSVLGRWQTGIAACHLRPFQ